MISYANTISYEVMSRHYSHKAIKRHNPFAPNKKKKSPLIFIIIVIAVLIFILFSRDIKLEKEVVESNGNSNTPTNKIENHD